MCEGEQLSVPSSEKNRQESVTGCAIGELIQIDEEVGWNKAVEIFLAEGRQARKGEELDLMR